MNNYKINNKLLLEKNKFINVYLNIYNTCLFLVTLLKCLICKYNNSYIL